MVLLLVECLCLLLTLGLRSALGFCCGNHPRLLTWSFSYVWQGLYIFGLSLSIVYLVWEGVRKQTSRRSATWSFSSFRWQAIVGWIALIVETVLAIVLVILKVLILSFQVAPCSLDWESARGFWVLLPCRSSSTATPISAAKANELWTCCLEEVRA
jgi:hypothetical protein